MITRNNTWLTLLKMLGIVGLVIAVASCAPAPSPVTAPTPTTAVQVAPTNAPAATTAPTSAPAATTAAASAPAATSASKVTVTIWGWWAERMKIFEDAAKDYMAKHPNVEIKVETYGDDLWPKVFASVPAGTGPSLLKMQTTNYFKLRDQGLVIELPKDAFPDSYLREKYPTHAWDAYGRYVYPEGIQPAILTYNKKMFADAGLDPNKPPKTWDEFFADAEKLTVRESNGTIKQAGVQFDDWFPSFNPLFELGGSIVKRDGDKLVANFDTPENEKAFQFFVDAAKKYKVWDPAFPYYSDAIGNKQAAMSVGEAWVYGTWKSDFPDTFKDLAYASPPTPTGDANPYLGRKNSVLGLALMKNRPPEETAAAQDFLEYLVKERLDTQLALDQIAGLVPARAELLSDKAVTEDPLLSLGVKLAEKQYDAVEIPDPLNDLLANTMNRILQENMSVKDALAQGQIELQKLIDNGDIKYLQ